VPTTLLESNSPPPLSRIIKYLDKYNVVKVNPEMEKD